MRILTVCTGNICRSPLAQYQLRRELDSEAFTVDSGGTRAVVGGSVPPTQLRIAAELQVPGLANHRGQQLTENAIAAADLILVGTLKHRAEVVRLVPSASPKTFTFREFAHLAKGVTADDIQEIVESGEKLMNAAVTAGGQRRGVGGPPEDYDVVDPFGEDDHVYERSAAQLTPAVADVAKYLRIVSKLEFGREEVR